MIHAFELVPSELGIYYKVPSSFIGLEVFTAVVIKSYIFWGITPCSPVETTDVWKVHVTPILTVEATYSSETSVH
jgi:hypothetical protein